MCEFEFSLNEFGYLQREPEFLELEEGMRGLDRKWSVLVKLNFCGGEVKERYVKLFGFSHVHIRELIRLFFIFGSSSKKILEVTGWKWCSL